MKLHLKFLLRRWTPALPCTILVSLVSLWAARRTSSTELTLNVRKFRNIWRKCSMNTEAKAWWISLYLQLEISQFFLVKTLCSSKKKQKKMNLLNLLLLYNSSMIVIFLFFIGYRSGKMASDTRRRWLYVGSGSTPCNPPRWPCPMVRSSLSPDSLLCLLHPNVHSEVVAQQGEEDASEQK